MSRTELFEYLLPGEWWSVDLSGDEETVARRIRRVVVQALGERDEFAQARHDVRSRLTEVAQKGRAIKASDVHIARSILGPLPFPATLTISQPGIATPVTRGRDESLQTMLSIVPGDDPVAIDDSALAVVRTVTRHEAEAADGHEATLTVNYWVDSAVTNRLTVFTFSTPLLELETVVLQLFDAIMLSVRARESSPGDRASAAVPGRST